MDVEAPAAPRWRKRMLPITHTRQRRSYFQPLLLGSPQRRNAARPRPRPHAGARGAGVAPRAAAPAIARGTADRDAPFGSTASSHLTYCPNAGAIVAFMLVFLGWYEFLVVPRLERMRRESVNKERCDYAATTLLLTESSTSKSARLFLQGWLGTAKSEGRWEDIWKPSDSAEAQKVMSRNAAWGLGLVAATDVMAAGIAPESKEVLGYAPAAARGAGHRSQRRAGLGGRLARARADVLRVRDGAVHTANGRGGLPARARGIFCPRTARRTTPRRWRWREAGA